MRVGLILTLLFCAATTPGQQTTAAQTSEVRIDFNRRVPMRDRTELSADVYRPKAEGRFPVILNRTPYTKVHSSSELSVVEFAVCRRPCSCSSARRILG
jgi:predicted acyl esterase